MRLAVVAADYTPGEADQLRRDMAAWRKSGRIERHHERLVSRMLEKGIAPEFAERVFEQIRGFGEYGFPESHAASFALIAYATAWLRHRWPAEFTCALLNAQPMGFYSVATIIDDARRHGLTVHPVCINRSRWDCILEHDRSADEGCLQSASPLPLRMGLRYVKGLPAEDGHRIEAARSEHDFDSLEDLARRCRLGEKSLKRLAESGALDCFENATAPGAGANRRATLWSALPLARLEEDSLPYIVAESPADTPAFEALDAFETIQWDYRSSGHSTRGHPLEPLRPELERRGLPDARSLTAMPDGRRVRYAGVVICRQRPSTAGGVVFMTLEDETGFVNLVLWERVFDQFSRLAKTASFLGVTGRIQRERDVVHLVAEKLWSPRLRRPRGGKATPPGSRSRDFH